MKGPGTVGIDAPSVVGRAVLSIVLLIIFYVLTVGIALSLLGLSAGLFVTSPRNVRLNLFALVLCGIPAIMLLMGILTVRRPWTPPGGRRLEESDAPELFAILAELGAAAGTAPPAAVYLTRHVSLSVTEMPTRRGGPKERVLFIGAPTLAWITVAELRAGLAHELGHFAFGDTRLLGIVSHAHASFRNVMENTRREPFADTGIQTLELAFSFARSIGDAIVTNYAKVFFWLTRPADRRAELAADQLAKRIAGPHALVRLLEKVSFGDPLYDEYLRLDVSAALAAGGVPTDLTAGFALFSARAREVGLSAEVERAVREQKTDPFDAHPALAVRVEKLLEGAGSPDAAIDVPADASADANPDADGDARAAASLVLIDVDDFLAEHLHRDAALSRGSSRPLVRLTWAEMAQTIYTPKLADGARLLAAKLFPTYPEARTACAMFHAVVTDIQGGKVEPLALVLVPDLANVIPHQRARVAHDAVALALETLFNGALIERGAEVLASLGEPCFALRFEGEHLRPGLIARAAISDPAAAAEASRWAARLAVSPSS